MPLPKEPRHEPITDRGEEQAMTVRRRPLDTLLPLADLKTFLGVSWSNDDDFLSALLQGEFSRVQALVDHDILAYDDQDPFAEMRLQQVRNTLQLAVLVTWYGSRVSRSAGAPDVATQAIRDLRAAYAERQPIMFAPTVFSPTQPNPGDVSVGAFWFNTTTNVLSVLRSANPDVYEPVTAAGGEAPAGLTVEAATALIAPFARADANIQDLTSIGPSDTTDGDHLFVVQGNETKRESIGAFKDVIAEEWAQSENDDPIPVGKLSNAPGLTQTQVDARVKDGVLDWAEKDNTDAIPSGKLGNAPGLTQTQVDARVKDGVLNWAEKDNTDPIPVGKLSNAPGLTQQQVDDRVTAGVSDWAEEGNTDEIPSEKLPAAMGGLTLTPVAGLQNMAVSAHSIDFTTAQSNAIRNAWNGDITGLVIADITTGGVGGSAIAFKALYPALSATQENVGIRWALPIISARGQPDVIRAALSLHRTMNGSPHTFLSIIEESSLARISFYTF